MLKWAIVAGLVAGVALCALAYWLVITVDQWIALSYGG